MILWRDQMSVGNTLIDQDHRYLVCLINSIELALRSHVPLNELESLLGSLSEYADIHFAREEEIMQAMKYPQLVEHKNHHLLLKMDFRRLEAEISDAYRGEQLAESTARHITELLRNWLLNHVIKEDMLMKPMFAGKKS